MNKRKELKDMTSAELVEYKRRQSFGKIERILNWIIIGVVVVGALTLALTTYQVYLSFIR